MNNQLRKESSIVYLIPVSYTHLDVYKRQMFAPTAVSVVLEPEQIGFVEAVTVTVGGVFTVNVPALEPEQPRVVTEIVPVLPDAGTAVICVALFTTNDCAATPPKVTAVAPVKLVPVITTEVELPQPEAGLNELIVCLLYTSRCV